MGDEERKQQRRRARRRRLHRARQRGSPVSSGTNPGSGGAGAAAARRSRSSRRRYSVRDLKIDSSSQWGEGVSVIESVLEPGGAAEAALTPAQRSGLRNLQSLLLRHGGADNNNAHVPRALLGSLHLEDEEEDDDSDGERESLRYLLSSFGGIVRGGYGSRGGDDSSSGSSDNSSSGSDSDTSSSSSESSSSSSSESEEDEEAWVKIAKKAERKVKNAVMTNKFVHTLMDSSAEHELKAEQRTFFVPPEWETLSVENKSKLRDMLSWESLRRWDFNALEVSELSGGHPLLMIGWAILGSPLSHEHMSESCGDAVGGAAATLDGYGYGYGYAEEFLYSMETLCGFLRVMEREYDRENPYHNSIHAADVLQTVNSLLQMGGIEFAQADIQSFSILLAAVVHDVGHPGQNNAFQVNAKSDLALRYNDISVLENMHASTAFQLLMGENRDPKINILGGMQPAQIDSVRKLVIDAILHTDMTKHFAMVDQMKGLLVSKDVEAQVGKNSPEHPPEMLNYMLHLADVSNPAKPAPMFLEWTDRCLEEFFSQGDLEKERKLPVSPLCDRDKTSREQSQIGFIQYVVEPAYEVLAKALPAVEDEIMATIGDNLKYWKALQEEKKSKSRAGAEKEAEEEKEVSV